MILLWAVFNNRVTVIFVEAVLSAWKDDIISCIYAISQLYLLVSMPPVLISFALGNVISPESDQLTSFFFLWGHMTEFESYLVALEDSQPW